MQLGIFSAHAFVGIGSVYIHQCVGVPQNERVIVYYESVQSSFYVLVELPDTMESDNGVYISDATTPWYMMINEW